MATDTLRFATIAVNAPVRRSGLASGQGAAAAGFHYAIPPALRGRLRVGQMVWVPFGSRRLAGIVTGFAEAAPVDEVREIEALVDERPVVIPSQIALAAWMAREYLAPFGRALWSMLPPGTMRTAETWVEAIAEPLPEGTALSPNQRAVWQALAGRGAVPLKRVANLARVAGWRPALTALVERGLVRQWDGDRPPAVRPKTERFLRALTPCPSPTGAADAARWERGESDSPLPPQGRGAGGEGTTGALQALARAPKQQVVYRYLLEQAQSGDGWLPLGQVLEATGAGRPAADALVARGLAEAVEREVWRDPLAGREFVLTAPPPLTPDQERAMQAVNAAIDSRLHHTFLLHGVTGSGKTEIYLQAAARVLAQGRRAIILVPEIALTPQTIRRVAARFPGRIAVWHSRLTAGERYDEWRRALLGQIDIVIGARSAILAPLRDLGLIVVDEEHEASYKQEGTTPRYHAREAAVALGRNTGACVILGSATPDVTSAYRAQTGAYTLLTLPQRVLSHRRRIEEHRARFNLPEQRVHLRPLPAEETGGPCTTGAPCTTEDTKGGIGRGDPAPTPPFVSSVVNPSPSIGDGRGCPAPTPPSVSSVVNPSSSVVDVLYAELPPVEVVDLRRELQAGNRSIFSRSLTRAIGQALAAHEQVILFLNRRGAATFVMCRDCGRTLTCPRCEVSLTYHSTRQELVCHHCNHHQPVAQVCPHCRSRRIKYFGLGTQRVVETVRELFPQARVVRWDRDTANRRGSHEELLRQFVEHEADVMVGTQMIAKGLDLPLVTVVGVISADTGLNLPDLRAAERTFQLLTQVAGRAGRSPLGGRVVVQTYTPDHYAVRAAARHDYAAFLARELAFRREHGYPPFGRLVRLTCADEDPARARQMAKDLAALLQDEIRGQGLADLDLVGPAPCPLERLRNQYRWQIIVRGRDPLPLVQQVPIPRGWRVDVDPVSFM
ncbi:MAG TPA: primosomal protein N' [Anaerolineae bacterium]|nr:primosomal protein N' [Anaerolineae bacterium]HPL26759.1 primosomal protein N' [Anaerolineae bacterium]